MYVIDNILQRGYLIKLIKLYIPHFCDFYDSRAYRFIIRLYQPLLNQLKAVRTFPEITLWLHQMEKKVTSQLIVNLGGNFFQWKESDRIYEFMNIVIALFVGDIQHIRYLTYHHTYYMAQKSPFNKLWNLPVIMDSEKFLVRIANSSDISIDIDEEILAGVIYGIYAINIIKPNLSIDILIPKDKYFPEEKLSIREWINRDDHSFYNRDYTQGIVCNFSYRYIITIVDIIVAFQTPKFLQGVLAVIRWVDGNTDEILCDLREKTEENVTIPLQING